MKKNLLSKSNRIIFCILLSGIQSITSQSIEKLFVNMPDILNPTLSKQNRLELLEYHKAGQGDSVANRFDHQALLLNFDTLHQQITVKNTPGSTFEMKIIHSADSSSIIGIIRTVCAPVCQSSVEFYDTAWNLIPLRFNMPKSIEWVDVNRIPSEKIDLSWVKSLMDISFISLNFSQKDQSIMAKNNTLDFISAEDRKVIEPYVTDKSISFELKGRTWIRN